MALSDIFPPSESDKYSNASIWPEFTSGGGAAWVSLPPQTKKYTNAFIFRDRQILLGMKKRGFGEGKYNGFGGKVHQNESSLEAAKRELLEEAGICAPLTHAGILLFVTQGYDFAHHIDIYRADSFSGEVTESEEMRPEWFDLPTSAEVTAHQTKPETTKQIPFEKMWDDDQHWYPLLLQQRPFIGRADFHQASQNTFIPDRFWFCAQPEA